MSERAAVIDRFLSREGWSRASRGPLANDASFRQYHRLGLAGRPAILMDAPPPHEDVRPFIRVARHLRRLGYSAPDLLATDETAGLLLLEDLGDATFSRLLAASADETGLYGLAIDLLIDLHKRGPAACFDDLPAYDDQRLMAEVMLLVDWYYPAIAGRPLADGAKEEWAALWRALFPIARGVPETLVLRDFHVDNLMRLPGRAGLAACGLLDFQDAVAGPLTYDVMSLLEDARRDIDATLVAAMRQRYLAAFPGLDRPAFDASWAVMAAQRHAKVIGIFTRLSRRDHKPIYLRHIPRVWRLLENAMAHPSLASVKRWIDCHLPGRGVPAP